MPRLKDLSQTEVDRKRGIGRHAVARGLYLSISDTGRRQYWTRQADEHGIRRWAVLGDTNLMTLQAGAPRAWEAKFGGRNIGRVARTYAGTSVAARNVARHDIILSPGRVALRAFLEARERDLQERFPGSDEALRRRFLIAFFRLLQRRLGEIEATTDGTRLLLWLQQAPLKRCC